MNSYQPWGFVVIATGNKQLLKSKGMKRLLPYNLATKKLVIIEITK